MQVLSKKSDNLNTFFVEFPSKNVYFYKIYLISFQVMTKIIFIKSYKIARVAPFLKASMLWLGQFVKTGPIRTIGMFPRNNLLCKQTNKQKTKTKVTNKHTLTSQIKVNSFYLVKGYSIHMPFDPNWNQVCMNFIYLACKSNP